MYQNILVPVDGSDTAKHGLAEAVKIAKHHGSRLRLLHVMNEVVLSGLDPHPSLFTSATLESLREGGRGILRAAQGFVREQGLAPESALQECWGRRAADAIIEQAEQWPADLIVMGTHGRRGLRRLALGSDAEMVVRSAPVPVLLVRDQ